MFQSARRGGSVVPLFVVVLLHVAALFAWAAPVRLDPAMLAASTQDGCLCDRTP